MRRRPVTVLLLLLSWGGPAPAWGWGDEGHEIVARIAAAHLTEHARPAVQRLLGADATFTAPPGGADSLAELMARAAIWPDHIPGGKGRTGPWHYIDIGLFEGPAAMEARCPNGNCVVAKMKQYLVNLKQHRADGEWSEAKEAAFLIHFAGDIHQPLHCATNGDAGGNCVNVVGFDPVHNLHAVWDITLVRKLVALDDGGVIGEMESRFRGEMRQWQNYGSIEKIAAESFALARTEVYAKARPTLPVIPTFVDVEPRKCAIEAPPGLLAVNVDGPRSYGAAAVNVVRVQLYKGGVRLAAMLNAIYGD